MILNLEKLLRNIVEENFKPIFGFVIKEMIDGKSFRFIKDI
jgi:hypothetical protein